MSIAEETIITMIQGMTDDEKRVVAKTLESEFMRDELIRRHENRANINITLGGAEK